MTTLSVHVTLDQRICIVGLNLQVLNLQLCCNLELESGECAAAAGLVATYKRLHKLKQLALSASTMFM